MCRAMNSPTRKFSTCRRCWSAFAVGGDVADTAALLVSELVTNAVQASDRLETAGSPVIRLWVSSDGTGLVIHVWDAYEEMPVRQDAGPDAVGGRGLLLVETLGKDWGAYRQARGKVVWVLLSRPDDP